MLQLEFLESSGERVLPLTLTTGVWRRERGFVFLPCLEVQSRAVRSLRVVLLPTLVEVTVVVWFLW